jgi:hypothetical protein
MADDKAKQYEAELLAAIKKHKFMRFDHCFSGAVSFSRATAYNHGLDKLDTIKEAIEGNRVHGVNYMLQKWISGNNATLQIAAMRMICTKEEHQLLNQQYIDHTTKGESMKPKIDLSKYTEDELRTLIELQSKGGVGE